MEKVHTIARPRTIPKAVTPQQGLEAEVEVRVMEAKVARSMERERDMEVQEEGMAVEQAGRVHTSHHLIPRREATE